MLTTSPAGTEARRPNLAGRRSMDRSLSSDASNTQSPQSGTDIFLSYPQDVYCDDVGLDIPDGWEILCVDSAQLLCSLYDKSIVKPTEALSSKCSS